MRTFLLIPLLLLAGCSPKSSPTPSPSSSAGARSGEKTSVLSWSGYGPVTFGMTIEAAVALAGARADSARALNPECDYIQFASLPGIRFMVEAGRITRGDAGPEVLNALDIPVGATLDAIKAAHPEARITPHKYDSAGHYVFFAGPQGRSGFLMEEHGGAIVRIRAGLEPAVEYVESCL